MQTRSQFNNLREELIKQSKELQSIQIHFHKSQVGLSNDKCILLNDESISVKNMLTIKPEVWYHLDWHYRKMFEHPLDQKSMKIIKDAPNFSTQIEEWNEPTRRWIEYSYLPGLQGSILYVGIQSQNECYYRFVKDPSTFETLDFLEDMYQYASPAKHYICDILNFQNEYSFDHISFFGIMGHADDHDTIQKHTEILHTFQILDRHVKLGGTLLLGPGTQTVDRTYWDSLYQLPMFQKQRVLKHCHEGTNVIWWGQKHTE